MRSLLAAALFLSCSTAVHAAKPGEEVQKLIRKLATDRDADTRASAAERLGAMGAVDAVPALAAALKDKDPSVRSSAAGALLALGESARSVMPALHEALMDGDSTTVWNAAAALRNMDVVTTDLMPAYRRLLQAPDCDMKISAATVISEYATPAELLEAALACRKDEGDLDTARDARKLMAQVAKDRAAIPVIVERLEDDRAWDVREWAARALGDLGLAAKSAAPALQAALDDPDERVRAAAEKALARVTPPKK